MTYRFAVTFCRSDASEDQDKDEDQTLKGLGKNTHLRMQKNFLPTAQLWETSNEAVRASGNLALGM